MESAAIKKGTLSEGAVASTQGSEADSEWGFRGRRERKTITSDSEMMDLYFR